MTDHSVPPPPGSSTRRQWLGATALSALGLLAPVPAAQAQELTDLAQVRARGVLKVAVYKDNPPYSHGSTQDLKGVDAALAQALAQQLELPLALLPFDAGERMDDDLRNMVWKGHYLGYGPADLMLHVPVDRYLIRENRQALIFAPYAREALVVFHHRAKLDSVQGADDLQGRPLAAESGSGAASALVGYGGGKLRAQVSLFNTGLLAAQAVVQGTAHAAYVSRAQAEAALHAAGQSPAGYGMTQLTLPGLADNGWPIGMAVKAGHTQLAQALEDGLNRLRASGRLAALYREHGLTLVAP